MGTSYYWELDKYEQNLVKHGLAFEDVIPMFEQGSYDLEFDDEHSEMGSTHDEIRFKALGYTTKLGFIIVIYSEDPEGIVKIISARPRKI